MTSSRRSHHPTRLCRFTTPRKLDNRSELRGWLREGGDEDRSDFTGDLSMHRRPTSDSLISKSAQLASVSALHRDLRLFRFVRIRLDRCNRQHEKFLLRAFGETHLRAQLSR